MFTRHPSATQKGISMHSDPNADQLAFEVDGAPTPNDSSGTSASAVTEPSTPPSSSASALDTLLNEYRARATSERAKGTLFEELTRQFLLHDAHFAHQFKEVYLWGSGRSAARVTLASTGQERPRRDRRPANPRLAYHLGGSARFRHRLAHVFTGLDAGTQDPRAQSSSRSPGTRTFRSHGGVHQTQPWNHGHGLWHRQDLHGASSTP